MVRGQPCRLSPLLPDAWRPRGLRGLEADAASCHGEAPRASGLISQFSLFSPFPYSRRLVVQVATLPGGFSWQPHLPVSLMSVSLVSSWEGPWLLP